MRDLDGNIEARAFALQAAHAVSGIRQLLLQRAHVAPRSQQLSALQGLRHDQDVL